MADDTTTSTGTGGDGSTSYTAPPVLTTTSVTATIGRPPRKLYFWIQLIAFVLTVGACFFSRRLHSSAQDIKDWPMMAEIMLKVGQYATQPLGMAAAACIVIGLGLLAIRGMLDGFLKILIWLNVFWLVAFVVVSTMSIWLPVLKALKGKGPG